jgi:hypothetical protein
MPAEIPYQKLKSHGYQFATPNRLAIFVHPYWTERALSDGIFNAWKGFIDKIAGDENFAVIATGIRKGPNGSEISEEWAKRIDCLLEETSQKLGKRFFEWKDGLFVETGRTHIAALEDALGFTPIITPDEQECKKLFFDAYVDGLYRGNKCVKMQKLYIGALSLSPPQDWPLKLSREDWWTLHGE